MSATRYWASFLTHATVVAGLFLPAAPTAGQQSGSLAGIVLDDLSGSPVREARIVLRSLGVDVETDATGQFLFEGVPLGTVEVRFEAPGYVSVVEEIEMSEAEFLQVRLSPMAVALDEVLVLTGRTPRRAPQDPAQLNHDGGTWRSVLNLLEDQVPGIVVRRRGALAAGASIRIRGMGTFQGNYAPDVYLDGVRIDSAANANALHVLDMIPAEAVARVRVYKGASAGAAMANPNGAIMIETHRGGTGPGR